jgi:mannose-6-phosphate isomerase-like protein (cupin superfamily)
MITKRSGIFDEQAVLDALAREGRRPSRWSNGPHDVYAPHSHGYHKVLYCLDGSIVFRLTATGEEIELHPGDRLDVEPGTEHSAVVGPCGVACIEAAR